MERLCVTQQMQLLLAGPQEFATFFAKEVLEWGKVAREKISRAAKPPPFTRARRGSA